MNSQQSSSVQQYARQFLAVALSFLLIAFTQSQLQAQDYSPMDAEQLNQLVAPIALYPDSLVAQILAASTYPQQVGEASNWVAQYGGMPPDQRAAAVDSMQWDPSVKALTEFPSVLDYMGRNPDWTATLGNVDYNQPGDVMNAIQAMRYRAQASGNLRTTPYQRVYLNGPEILIAPVNPGLVYVPYYDPWAVYGDPISPWRGFYMLPRPRGLVWGAGLAIGFAAAVSIGMYAHYGWGWHAWSPNWHGGVVIYNHNTYYSRSTTVYNHGRYGGYNRDVYEHGGRGVPGNFHPPVTSRTAVWAHGGGGGSYSHGGDVHHPGPPPAGSYHPSGSYHPGTPAGGYHPGTPAGGYHSGTPAGGYHSGTPAGSSHTGTPSGGYHAGTPSGGYHGAPSGSPAGSSHHSTPAGGSYHPSNTPIGHPSGSSGSPTPHVAGGSSVHSPSSHSGGSPGGASPSHSAPPQHSQSEGTHGGHEHH